MYCTECGKPNPQEARFCAYCGVKLKRAEDAIDGAVSIGESIEAAAGTGDEPSREEAPPTAASSARDREGAQRETPPRADGPAKREKIDMDEASDERKAEGEPVARKVQSAAAKSVRRRPADPSRTVVPTSENPAQPVRPGERSPYARPVKPAQPAPAPVTKGEPEAEKTEPADEPKPRRKVTHRPPNKVVTASGEEESPPARRPPVKKSYQRVGEAPNTLVPDRVRQQKIDLFFDDEDDEDYEDYEDYDEERGGRIRRRILSIVGSVLVLGAFIVAFWLLVTTSGQVFRASMGLGAPASAYKVYGDQLREKGNIIEAAGAYYDALRLEPDNFQYALLTAQTQEIIGDNETAERAYLKCIDINDAATEPYRLLALMYERLGNADRQLLTLQTGYDKTQSVELKEMLDRIVPEPVQGDPVETPPEEGVTGDGTDVAPAPPDDGAAGESMPNN